GRSGGTYRAIHRHGDAHRAHHRPERPARGCLRGAGHACRRGGHRPPDRAVTTLPAKGEYRDHGISIPVPLRVLCMRGRLVRPRRFPTMLKIRPAALLLPVIWTMASCGTPHVEKTDANSEPQRIVTLNGTLTEIVAALGRADRIVGVDVTSTWPEKIAGVPRVGHDRTVRAEGVIALEPDLVLAGPGQLNTTVRDQLQQAGQRVVELPQDHSVEGTRTLIRQVAELLHDPAEGETLIAAMDLDLARVKPIAEPPKVLFIYARGAGSLMV